jgi:hypothetical protein
MRIREYTPADFDALRRMHAAQGFGYPLPDLDSPLFVSKLVLEDDTEDCDPANDAGVDSGNRNPSLSGREERDGKEANREVARGDSLPERSGAAHPKRVAMAVFLRLTAEAYLLHDPADGTPRLRWQRFLALHEAARRSAAERGLDDVQAFLPPPVSRAFGRRLSRLGWRRDPWDCFSRRV